MNERERLISDEMVEAAARAIAKAWGEEWECCCTEKRGLDCDCGDAMVDEREGYDERLSREDCRMAARAALAALTPVEAVPVVKALEWRGPLAGFYEADGFGGVIQIMDALRWDKPGNWILYPTTNERRKFDTLDAAKAAAQADYERRILSALEPSPASVPAGARVTDEMVEAHRYAERLLVALMEKHYPDRHPKWEPLPDLVGVLTQIDNLTTGLVRAQPASGEGWRSMDSAPKDGKHVLLCVKSGAFFYTVEGVLDPVDGWVAAFAGKVNPVYWAPKLRGFTPPTSPREAEGGQP